jgi:hypothetical protein
MPKTIRSMPPIQCGRAKPSSRHGPNRKSSALRARAPATMPLGHFIWSIPNSRDSRCDRRSLARRRRIMRFRPLRPLSVAHIGFQAHAREEYKELAGHYLMLRYSTGRSRLGFSFVVAESAYSEVQLVGLRWSFVGINDCLDKGRPRRLKRTLECRATTLIQKWTQRCWQSIAQLPAPSRSRFARDRNAWASLQAPRNVFDR